MNKLIMINYKQKERQMVQGWRVEVILLQIRSPSSRGRRRAKQTQAFPVASIGMSSS